MRSVTIARPILRPAATEPWNVILARSLQNRQRLTRHEGRRIVRPGSNTRDFAFGQKLAAEEARGSAAVKYGNEILIETPIIRLFGILVPKTEDVCQIETAKMKCGVVARLQLIQLADGWHLFCDIEQKAKSGKIPQPITAESGT